MRWLPRITWKDEPARQPVVERNFTAGRQTERVEELLKARLENTEISGGNLAGYYENSAAVHAAMRVLMEAVSRPAMLVQRLDASGDVETVDDHPLVELLEEPSTVWTMSELVREIEGSLLLEGSAFLGVSHENGFPSGLRAIRATAIEPVIRNYELIGYVEYGTEAGQDSRTSLAPSEVVWFRRFNPREYFQGTSPIRAVRTGVEMADEALAFNRRFYLNSAMPSDVVIEGLRDVSDADRLIEDWDARAFDPMMAHRPMMLTGEATMHRLGGNQRDMEFVDSLGWTINDVSRAFGVPKVFLSDLEDATLSNIEVLEGFLWRNTVVPELLMLQDTFTKRLASQFNVPGGKYRIRFDLADIEALRSTEVARASMIQGLVEAGIMPVATAQRLLEIEA